MKDGGGESEGKGWSEDVEKTERVMEVQGCWVVWFQ